MNTCISCGEKLTKKWDFFARSFFTPNSTRGSSPWWKIYWALWFTLLFPRWDVAISCSPVRPSEALVNLLLVFQRFTPAPILEMRPRKIWLMLMICCYFNRYKFNSMDISCYFLMTRDSQWKNWQKNMCVNGVFSENIRIQVWCWTI